MISQSHIEQFQRDGFLVVEDVLSPDEVAALQHAPRAHTLGKSRWAN